MGVHDEFLAEHFPDGTARGLAGAILATPNVTLPKLVYADWLDERGDPRGELVRLIVEGESATERAAELRTGCSVGWLSVMRQLHPAFDALALRVDDPNFREGGWRPSLTATFDCGLWDVHYSGDLMEEPFPTVLTTVADERLSPVVRSIRLDGHEDRNRINGTLHLTITPLVAAGVSFPHLEHFETERDYDETEQHSIVIDRGFNYQDTGELAALLANSPRLKTLIVPSPPNADFFTGPPHPLETLDVYCAFVRQRFIPNLARSTRFPNLNVLRFRDNCDGGTACQDENGYTTFAEFAGLLTSPNTAHIETVEFLDTVLSAEEMQRLLAIRSRGVRVTRSRYA